MLEALLFTATFWSARLEIILTRQARANMTEGLAAFDIKRHLYKTTSMYHTCFFLVCTLHTCAGILNVSKYSTYYIQAQAYWHSSTQVLKLKSS